MRGWFDPLFDGAKLMSSKMRFGVCLITATLLLSGCNRAEPADGPEGGHHQGRYEGVGIYSPSDLWSKVAGQKDQADQAIARLKDDDEIIVVVDSKTGEVRQCGNHTGFCVTMNPWEGQATVAKLPLKLIEHAPDRTLDGAVPASVPEPAVAEIHESKSK